MSYLLIKTINHPSSFIHSGKALNAQSERILAEIKGRMHGAEVVPRPAMVDDAPKVEDLPIKIKSDIDYKLGKWAIIWRCRICNILLYNICICITYIYGCLARPNLRSLQNWVGQNKYLECIYCNLGFCNLICSFQNYITLLPSCTAGGRNLPDQITSSPSRNQAGHKIGLRTCSCETWRGM